LLIFFSPLSLMLPLFSTIGCVNADVLTFGVMIRRTDRSR
jgi:hypothetical protein